MPTKTNPKPKKKPESTSEPDVSATKSANDLPPAATEEPLAVIEDEQAASIIARHVQYADAGLIITGQMTFEEWEKGLEFYKSLRSKTQWMIGDWLRYGEVTYGEDKYTAAIDISGKSESRLQTYNSVCGRFTLERRNPRLSFDHHAECAYIDHRESDALLIKAERERWSKMDVRAEVARINERNGVPKRGRKPTGTAAKVAASGKTPQIALIEAEKPLIWNGYPLSVMVMPDQTRVILQGNEPLPTEEADRAAHHHGHAHGPNLAKWLEEHNFRKDGDQPCAQQPQPTYQPAPATQTPSGVTGSETVPVAGASNGAVVVQPDAAPVIVPQMSDSEVEARAKSAMERINANSPHPDAPQTAQPASEPVASPVEPKATPAPPAPSYSQLETLVTELQKQITAQGSESWIEIQKTCSNQHEALKKYREAEKKIAEEPPIEAAERHILAFNAASEQVDWSTLGNLAKKKWLERLLIRADQVIDILQKQPITPRK